MRDVRVMQVLVNSGVLSHLAGGGSAPRCCGLQLPRCRTKRGEAAAGPSRQRRWPSWSGCCRCVFVDASGGGVAAAAAAIPFLVSALWFALFFLFSILPILLGARA